MSSTLLRSVAGWLLLSLPVGGVVAADSESASELVARAIQHHGGELFEGRQIAFRICSASGCFAVRTRVEDGWYEHEVSDERGRRVRATNQAVTRWQDGEPVEVGAGEEQRWRDWVNARLYFGLLPYRLQDPSVNLQDLGVEVWNDRPLRRIKVTFEAGSSTSASDEHVHWFDPETARLVQFSYSFAGNPGGLRFRQLYDYRRIGGILFYDQRNLGVSGDGLSVDDLTPEGVASMEEVSVVELRDIVVEPQP